MKMKAKGKIRFIAKDRTNFFGVLKSRVDNYFIENKISQHANASMVIKSIILIGIYASAFCLILTSQFSLGVNMLLWAVMGISLSGVGMSVMHDANHGSYSSNQYVNLILGHTLNLLGGSVHNWKLQHNILHHTYTNIIHMDDDIADKLVLRFSPHTNVKWYHKFQVVYAFLFYGVLTLYWAGLKDLTQFIQYTRNGVNTNTKTENVLLFLKISVAKLSYFFLLIYMPITVFNIPAMQIITGFLLMHFFAGLILTVVFQLAHTVEGTSHPIPNDSGNIENDWAIHQLNTTVNFARHNKLISWYVGGLNFQVEHHLFPRICHVHYPEIAKIVKATCEEYNVPYLENKSFGDALQSHIRTLVRFGKLPSLNEAIG